MIWPQEDNEPHDAWPRFKPLSVYKDGPHVSSKTEFKCPDFTAFADSLTLCGAFAGSLWLLRAFQHHISPRSHSSSNRHSADTERLGSDFTRLCRHCLCLCFLIADWSSQMSHSASLKDGLDSAHKWSQNISIVPWWWAAVMIYHNPLPLSDIRLDMGQTKNSKFTLNNLFLKLFSIILIRLMLVKMFTSFMYIILISYLMLYKNKGKHDWQLLSESGGCMGWNSILQPH